MGISEINSPLSPSFLIIYFFTEYRLPTVTKTQLTFTFYFVLKIRMLRKLRLHAALRKNELRTERVDNFFSMVLISTIFEEKNIFKNV